MSHVAQRMRLCSLHDVVRTLGSTDRDISTSTPLHIISTKSAPTYSSLTRHGTSNIKLTQQTLIGAVCTHRAPIRTGLRPRYCSHLTHCCPRASMGRAARPLYPPVSEE